jgi:hypothetical protein
MKRAAETGREIHHYTRIRVQKEARAYRTLHELQLGEVPADDQSSEQQVRITSNLHATVMRHRWDPTEIEVAEGVFEQLPLRASVVFTFGRARNLDRRDELQDNEARIKDHQHYGLWRHRQVERSAFVELGALVEVPSFDTADVLRAAIKQIAG